MALTYLQGFRHMRCGIPLHLSLTQGALPSPPSSLLQPFRRGPATAECSRRQLSISTGPVPVCRRIDLGRVSYSEAWELQKTLLHARTQAANAGLREQCGNVLLFLEHSHVYTLGRAASEEDLLFQPGDATVPADVLRVDRGGKITYHGPGQLVVYPLLDLQQWKLDLRWYVHSIEEVIIRSLAGYGMQAGRHSGYPGVWVGGNCSGVGSSGGNAGLKDLQGTAAAGARSGAEEGSSGSPSSSVQLESAWQQDQERKIAQVGMNCSKWFTMHGLALNVQPDMAFFRNIVPCGIQDRAVTSMALELQQMERERERSRGCKSGAGVSGPPPSPDMQSVMQQVQRAFQEVFAAEVVPCSLEEELQHCKRLEEQAAEVLAGAASVKA